jgi:hypothetical protein
LKKPFSLRSWDQEFPQEASRRQASLERHGFEIAAVCAMNGETASLHSDSSVDSTRLRDMSSAG